jgi:hypothetical protein
MVILAVGCMVSVIRELHWRSEVQAQTAGCFVRDLEVEQGCCETQQITGTVKLDCGDNAGNTWQCVAYRIIRSQHVPRIREVTSGGLSSHGPVDPAPVCTHSERTCGTLNNQCPARPSQDAVCEARVPFGEECK